MKWLLLLVAFPAFAQTSGQATSTSTGQTTVTTAPVQSIHFPDGPSTSTIRNVPSIFAPSFAPSTPCSSVLSASAGFAGFGFALGGSHVDKECNMREMARLLHLIGQPDAALALLCIDDSVKSTSPQLCARSAYVADKPAEFISSQPAVMPPAPVRPAKAEVTTGTVGYGTDNKKYVFDGAAWRPETAVQLDPKGVPK